MNPFEFPVEQLAQVRTPFYYYDLDLLRNTLSSAKRESSKYGYKVHYALKANSNKRVLEEVKNFGFGADCVSGGEVDLALKTGFKSNEVVFAGVGKTDEEIKMGILNDIFCFNCESIPELLVIEEIAASLNRKARIALRINPHVDAHTHAYITTGLKENKFGIDLQDIDLVHNILLECEHVELIGLHFHIGSQVRNMNVFAELALKVNVIQDILENKGIVVKHLNLGGGLGINYENPDFEPIPDFAAYFGAVHQYLKLRKGQEVHFELGRSLVGQSGTLVSRVLYVKEKTGQEPFLIVDAGMTDLIRPALYQASHAIQNLSRICLPKTEQYTVVGPICESSDTFGKHIQLPQSKRGDILIIRSSGAYGEVMASQYNARALPNAIFSDDIRIGLIAIAG